MHEIELEQIGEAAITQAFRQIPKKIDEFKRLLGITYDDAYSSKQVLLYAISLSRLIQDSKTELEESDLTTNDTTALLWRIDSPCTLRLAQLLYLAQDIVTEFEHQMVVKVL